MTRLLTTIGSLAVAVWVAAGSEMSAQPAVLILQIAPSLFIRDSSAGVDVLRGINLPVTSDTGATVGTASVTAVLQHPTLAYLPLFGEIRSGNRRFHVNRLVSRDGRFRQTLAFESDGVSPNAFFGAGIVAPVDLPGGAVPFTLSLRGLSLEPTSFGVNSVFDFTSERVQSTVGSTAVAYRPSATWSLAQAFGRKDPVGTNFSFAFANAAMSGNVNWLELDGQNGGLVACLGNPPVCGWKGVGGYDGIYGSAVSAAPAQFGLTADAASTKQGTHLAAGSQLAPLACPPGFTPPGPTDVLVAAGGTFANVEVFISWGSVACAVQYVVETEFSDGSTTRFVTATTNYHDVLAGSDWTRVSAFRVAGVSADGRIGPFVKAHGR